MKDVEGKVAFITGGGSGIGLGMAKVFLRAGMKVVIADVRRDHLDEAVAAFDASSSARVHPIELDVTDRAAMARAADEVERVFGKVHVLCNNAGLGILGRMTDASYDDWDWILGVNLGGVINGVQTFVPRIRAHGEGGHVMSTASGIGLFAGPPAGIYIVSKYAVVGMMESLRGELVDENIGVSVLCPGDVKTQIYDGEETRPAAFMNSGYGATLEERNKHRETIKEMLKHGKEPEEVGEMVLKAIRDNELYIITDSAWKKPVEDRFEAILKAFPDDPGKPRPSLELDE